MSKHVSRKQCAQWLQQWQDLFQLNDWELGLVCHRRASLDKGRISARIYYDNDTQHATVEVAAGQDPEAVRQSLGHEVLHLVLAELETAGKLACDQLHRDARNALLKHINASAERAVHRLERALEKLEVK